MTVLEQIEELQYRQNAYLDEGDNQEAYWVGLEIQALIDELEAERAKI